MCLHCARGGCTSLNGERPNYRALASASSTPAPTIPTIIFSTIGFRVHPPKPAEAELSFNFVTLRSSTHKRPHFHSRPQPRWIGIGLRVLAA